MIRGFIHGVVTGFFVVIGAYASLVGITFSVNLIRHLFGL